VIHAKTSLKRLDFDHTINLSGLIVNLGEELEEHE
jgi:hypothetical protein